MASTLQFLTLASNKITIVQGLKSLKVLGFLDLSDNFIERFDIDELPKSLVFVLFKNNKCASLSNYRYANMFICSVMHRFLSACRAMLLFVL